MRFLPIALPALALAGGLALAPTAFAAERAEATLAQPVSAPVEKIVDGRIWRCEGSTCIGGSGFAKSQPITRECSRAAKQLGQFTAFRRGERALDAEQMKACGGAPDSRLAQGG
jgi:hypothetical protein